MFDIALPLAFFPNIYPEACQKAPVVLKPGKDGYPAFGGSWHGEYLKPRRQKPAARLVRVGKDLRLAEKPHKIDDSWLETNPPSVRACNVLLFEGFESETELRVALAAGLKLRNITNCGKLTEQEILNWLNERQT